MKRSPELDFLRGIAVILVLFRHHWVGINALQHVGWIGVDLFFVLSGFLISGLLFKEQEKFGNIRPFYFLIRRGFKIYPLFYTSLIITAIASHSVQFATLEGLNVKGQAVVWLSEIFFLQNYVAYIWIHHWSLAVEEHFYLLVALLFPFMMKNMRFAPVVFILCLALRIVTAIYHPEQGFSETHLRLDSLFMGVCISYAYHHCDLKRFYEKYKRLIACATAFPILFLFDDPTKDEFTKTIGFPLLYVSFGSLLLIFLFEDVSKVLWPPIVRIGTYSYGIYLFHLYLIKFVVGETYLLDQPRDMSWYTLPSFLLFFFGSIFLGIAMSKLVELPFLQYRDKYFPRRAA